MTDAQSEFVERYAQRGPKGDKGDKGDKGTEGNDATRLPVGQGRAIVYLFVLNLLFVAACFAGLVYYVRAGNQERCASLERRCCRTLTICAACRRPWRLRLLRQP